MDKEVVQKDNTLKPEKLTKRDIFWAWLRFYFADEIPHSFDRYIAPWSPVNKIDNLNRDFFVLCHD